MRSLPGRRALVDALDRSAAGRRLADRLRSERRRRDERSTDPRPHRLYSYSQFGEDAVLRGFFRRREEDRLRADPDATEGPSPVGEGFYVDVGCYHPFRFSNTMHFHEQGWGGINVDASAGTKAHFDLARPDDVNLEVAVSETDGSVTFYEAGTGARSVFNTLDPAQAEAYQRSGRVETFDERVVPGLRLETILDRHLPAGQEISFLDVDVEGHDLEVLRSNDWDRYRPVLVVVESHRATIDDVRLDPTYDFMTQQGYTLQSWVRPNLIWRRD